MEQIDNLNQTTISFNDYQLKVYRAPTKTGYGIFTAVDLIKEDVNFINYTGYVKNIKYFEQLSNINPNYIVNLWQEMVVYGDTETGDLGILINFDCQSDGNVRFVNTYIIRVLITVVRNKFKRFEKKNMKMKC